METPSRLPILTRYRSSCLDRTALSVERSCERVLVIRYRRYSAGSLMFIRLFILATATVTLWAQGGRGGAPSREAPVSPVPFERILRANREPQNWLTFSG